MYNPENTVNNLIDYSKIDTIFKLNRKLGIPVETLCETLDMTMDYFTKKSLEYVNDMLKHILRDEFVQRLMEHGLSEEDARDTLESSDFPQIFEHLPTDNSFEETLSEIANRVLESNHELAIKAAMEWETELDAMRYQDMADYEDPLED